MSTVRSSFIQLFIFRWKNIATTLSEDGTNVLCIFVAWSYYLMSIGNKLMVTKWLIVLSGLSEAQGPTLGSEVCFYASHVSLYIEQVVLVQFIL